MLNPLATLPIENTPYSLLKAVADVAEKWPWLEQTINAVAVNNVVNVCRHRPHPWSTAHDYISWTSLTDSRWSARHLPAKRTQGLPAAQNLTAFFQRRDKHQRLCPKSSCLFPAFAQYLTDGFIRTRMPRHGQSNDVRRQNTSNHQIDMCPLYGRTQEQTDALRLRSEAPGERGRLKSQMIQGEEFAPFLFDANGTLLPEFASLDEPLGLESLTDPELKRKLFAFGGDRTNATPQVAMMNTLFLREHNRLAGEIEADHTDWEDERVFQVARNTVIVLFIKIVVEEYINHISPVPLRFKADPSVAWDAPWNKPNWITAEFSLLYRWHSLVPDVIEWNGRSHPLHTTLMNNQLLLDAGLTRAFVDASAQQAGQLGAFNTADAILHVEANAVEQGRLINLAPYSDYREYVALPRPKRFEDVSPDRNVVEFLRAEYRSVEDIDFYIGLFAEPSMQNSPLPPLILRLVAVDAFSQALTNPLLSKPVFKPSTFSAPGWRAIQATGTLKDVLVRNGGEEVAAQHVGMTRKVWRPV